MLRLLYRQLVNQRQSEVDALLAWCISNPGYKNVYIKTLQSQIFPFIQVPKIITNGIRKHMLNFALRRSISTLRRPVEPTKNVMLLNKRYSEVEKLISDADIRNKYLDIIRNGSTLSKNDVSMICTNFLKVIDIVNGFPTSESIDLLLNMWKFVFQINFSNENVKELQHKFLSKKEPFITILINTKNYSVYKDIVEPVYSIPEFKNYKSTWTDTLANTFQLDSDDKGHILFNKGTIILFLKNPQNSIDIKRRLLATFLKKGVLYSSSINQTYYVTKEFINLLHEIGDDHMLFKDHEHFIYDKAFRLIAIPPKGVQFSDHLHSIKNIIDSSACEYPQTYYNFMTTSMRTILRFSPHNVLNYWHIKLNLVEEQGLEESDVFRHTDLKSAMSAFCLLNMYQSVLDLYQKFTGLRHEEQIEVLLRVSEEFKDWKLLQKQFEDMYGKGQLPYVVHYSIVMNALAAIGAKDEVNQLFNQLLKRNLRPTPSIYAALINSETFYGNVESSKYWFDEYLKQVKANTIDPNSGPYLYSLIFKLYLKSSNLDAAMKFLEAARDEQERLNITLVDTKTISKFINFAGTMYGLKELEILRKLGQELNLTSDEYYENLIRAYTRLDQYEKANEVVFEAHLESDVPFTSPDIYKVQLRNYRFWYRNTPSHETQIFISDRIRYILEHVVGNNISNRNNHGLYTEIIKLHLARNDLSSAEALFNFVKNQKMLSEHHFTPFLDYHANLRTFAGYSHVLELYRQMAKERVNISTKTYVHLIKALIHLDALNHKGYENSFKLLKSVFELNGLTISPTDPAPRNPQADILDNSIDLCNIITSYVMATVGYQNNVDLLVHFLNQMKERLNGKLTNEFKFSIYKELGRLYLKQGNFALAKRLIDNGLEESHNIISKFIHDYPYNNISKDEIQIPKRLQYEYRSLLSLKLKCMKTSFETPESYYKLFQDSEEANIKLSGDQYLKLINELLKLSNPEVLRSILKICEDHLVAGNWAEVKLFRKLQFLYKLTVLHFSRTAGIKAVQNNYDMLNRYYNILDIPQLQSTYLYIHDPLELLKRELDEFNEIHTKTHSKGSYWTLDRLLLNIPEFFSPEIRLSTQNKISPYFASRMWHLISGFCGGDKYKAFQLMDEFPETIEFLIYNSSARLRLQVFRKEIDQIQLPPTSDQREDFESRRLRTLEVLNHLKSTHSSY